MTETNSSSGAGVAVLIPARDEEIHLRRAIRSVSRLGRVFVIDGGSRDRTRPVAEEEGATVVAHAWEGYAAQKNWALQHLEFEEHWVLFLDADEWVTQELAVEIDRAIERTDHSGFYIPRRNIFLGRMLRHAWWYPDYQLRLFVRTKGRYEQRLVHEHLLLDGPAGFLEHPLMHENLKGIDAFVARHLRYAGLEAREILNYRAGVMTDQRKGNLLGTWPERRRALKLNVWYRLPWRPAIRFLWMYLLRRGFLDGRQGRVYCELIAAQESLINAKLVELELGEQGDSDPRRN